MRVAYYIVVERWHWSPESMGALDVDDLLEHADVINAISDHQAALRQPPETSNGRKVVPASSLM